MNSAEMKTTLLDMIENCDDIGEFTYLVVALLADCHYLYSLRDAVAAVEGKDHVAT